MPEPTWHPTPTSTPPPPPQPVPQTTSTAPRPDSRALAAARQAEVAWWLLRPPSAPRVAHSEIPEPWDPPVPESRERERRVQGSAGAFALARTEARFRSARGRERQTWGLETARLRLQLGDLEGAAQRAEGLLSEDDLPPDLALEAMALMVEVCIQQGRFEVAGEILRRASREVERAEVPEERALVAWARARWALEGGRYADAGKALEEAETWIARMKGPRARQLKGQVGGLRGRYLADLGDQPRALRALDAALNHLPPKGEAQVGLRALRAFLAAQGGGGTSAFEATAKEAHRLGMPLLEASLGNNAGCARLKAGQRAMARTSLLRAFQLARVLDQTEASARVAVNLAAVDLAEGKAPMAVSRLLWARAEALHPLTQAAADHGLMVGWSALGRLDLAILAGKTAVDELQFLQGRAGLQGPAAAVYRAANAETFRILADLLIQDGGRLAEAQEVLALLKEDEYGRFLGRDATPTKEERPTLTGEEVKLGARSQEARGAWMTLARELEGLRRQPLESLSPADRELRTNLESMVKEARMAYQASLRSLREAARAEGAESAERLASRQLERLSGLQGRLGPDTALLSYILGQDRLHILVTTSRLQIHRETAITPQELAKAVQALRWALTDRSRDARPEAKALHELLIEPVAADLKAAQAQRLLLDLDGPLRYLPFATLYDGSEWLVERYALAVAARGAFAAVAEAAPGRPGAAAFGVSQAHGAFSALAAVPAELQGVLAGLQAVGTPGRSYLDETFTADRLKELDGISIVHVASHFQFRPGTHEASALLVGDGSLLSLKSLRDEGVRFDGVRMLSLSACQTAMGGGRDDQGVEVEGLGAVALDLGAQSVVATLWKVADASTAELMQDFYRRWGGGDARAEALRASQLRLLRKDGTPRDWSHPFYWAPFTLLGAWR